ncbi:MAG: hypothetical protein AAB900_00135, partial [Patescibacteria group bacterium]
LNMQYGLDSIGGYEPFMPRRVSEVLAYVGSEQVTTGGTLAEVAPPPNRNWRRFWPEKIFYA